MANLKYIGKNILNHDLILKKGDVSGSNASSASFGHINISNNASVDGNLVVDGRLTAQEIHTEIESASIIFSSGSTLFGNTQDDIHTFTGSLKVTGSVTALNLTADSSSFSTRITNLKTDSGSFSTRITADSSSFSARVTTAEIELENTIISASAQISSRISGSFTAPSASISTRLTTEEANVDALQTDSGSFSTRTTTLEAASASFSTRVTTAEEELELTLISGSAQLASQISGAFTDGFEFDGTISGSVTSTGSFGSVMQNGKHFPQTNAPGENIAFGTDAGSAFVGGNVNKINIAIGSSAGTAMADYGGNVFIGKNAAKLRTRGDDNVAIGTSAGGTDGDDFGDKNVFIGLSTGLNINSIHSDSNVFVGNLAGTAGQQSIANVLVGSDAGKTLTNSSRNVAVGLFAGTGFGVTNTTTENSIYIGQYARTSVTNANNEIVIGSEAVGHGTDTITFGDNQITDVYFASGSSTGATFHGVKQFSGNISGSATSTGSFGRVEADSGSFDSVNTSGNITSAGGVRVTGTSKLTAFRTSGQFIEIYPDGNGSNYLQAQGNIRFAPNLGTKMILHTTGRLGLNTTVDAGYLLDVNGTGRFSDTLEATHFSGSQFTGIFNGALSGSAQIASNISGAFAVASASFAADILSNSSSFSTRITADSSSFAARDTLSEATSSKILNGELEFTNITGSGHISMSLSSTGSFGRVSATTIGGHSPLVIDGKTTFVHSITSSAHVSSSMTSTASFGRVNVIGLGGHQNLTIDPITTFTNVITASANVNFDSKIFIQTGSIEGDLHVRTNADLMRIGKSTAGLLVSGSGEIQRFATASNGDLIDLGFTILDEDGNSVLAGDGDGIHVDDNNYWYNNRFYKVGNGSTKFLEYDAIDLKYKGQVFATTGSIDGEMYIKSPTGSMFIGKYTGGIPTSGSSTTIPRFATGSDGSLVDLGFTTTDEDGNTVFLTTGDGIVVDSNNYWYTTGHFKIGNSKNFINWNTSNLTISGTFVGDGSGLTGVSGGGSSFTKAGISGSFTVLSSSFSSRLTTAEAELSLTLLSSSAQVKSLLPTNVISSSKQIASGISGSVTEVSGALSTRLTTLEGNAVFTSAGISGSTTVLSSSLASRIKSLEAGGVTVPTNTVSSSAQLASRISGSFTALSASLAGRITSGGGGGSDNLGNHTATQDLSLDGNDIVGILNITASGDLDLGTFSDATTNLRIRTGGGGSGTSMIKFRTSTDNYGYSIVNEEAGSSDRGLRFRRHENSATGVDVLKLRRDNGTIEFPIANQIISGSATSTGSFGRVEAVGVLTAEHISSTDDMTVGDDLTVSGLTTSDTAVIGGTSITQTNTILEINKASGNHHLTMLAADNASNSLRFRNASGQEVYAGMFGDVANGANKFGVYAGGLRFVVNQSGNIGIGQTDPTSMLHIAKSDGTAYDTNATTLTGGGLVIENTSAAAGKYSIITFQGHPYDSSTYDYAQIGAKWTSDGNSELFFKTEDAGTVREVMRIADTGNVGIGTTNPGVALEVIGSVSGSATSTGSFGRVEVTSGKVLGDSTSAVSIPFSVTGGTSAAAGGLQFGAYNANFGGIWSGAVTPAAGNYALVASATRTVINADTDIGLYLDDATVLLFANSNGVAIGGSTSPSYKLDVGGTGRFTGDITAQGNIVGDNATNISAVNDITVLGDISGSATSTGSFGHIIGDGSGITNVTSTVPTGTVSGSAQITAGLPSGVISGSSGNLTVTNTITATTGSISNIQTPLTGRVISNFTEMIKVTVVSDGGNHYAFEGATAPSIQVSEGKTYRFDISDSTVGSHPFRFSTTQDGQHNGGSAYTTGVTVVGTQGQAGAYVEIQITKGTANALYYYCTAHPGMGNDGRLLKNDLMNLAAIKVTGNQVDFTNLPTSDPSVAGRLWNDSGTVKISSG